MTKLSVLRTRRLGAALTLLSLVLAIPALKATDKGYDGVVTSGAILMAGITPPSGGAIGFDPLNGSAIEDEPIVLEVGLTDLPDFSEVWNGETLVWEKALFTDSGVVGSTGIPFGLALPAGYSPGGGQQYPLVIYLHGADARGNNDNKNLLRRTARFFAHQALAVPAFESFVLSPQVPTGQQFVNVNFDYGPYEQSASTLTVSMQLTENLIRYLTDPAHEAALSSILGLSAADVDTTRLYLVGDSMGAYGTWDTLGRGAIAYAAAMGSAGSGPWNRLAQIQETPLWVIHGEVDTVVPNYLPHLGDPNGAGSLGMLGLIDLAFDNTTSTVLIRLDNYATTTDDPTSADTLIYSQYPGQFDHAAVAADWTASMVSDFSSWLFGYSTNRPPQIVTQPETPVGAYVGDTISLSVEATGADPIQYQWTKAGVNLAGATTATFMKTNAQVSDSGLYAVKVTNPGGTVTSSNAVVTVTVPTLWQFLESTPELSTFKTAIEVAGLVQALQQGSLTLFTPTDAAFEALPAGVWDDVLADPEQLLEVLSYHALPDIMTTVDLVPGLYQTIQGSNVVVTVPAAGVLMVNEAEVTIGDQLASNGVAHVIDTVLLLPEQLQIVTQPETSVVVYVGDTITLSVEATGTEPIQYQWTKDGVDLEGATSTTFVKADAQVPDSGLYAVKLSSPGGTATSSNAVVTVTLPTLWHILELTPELSTLKAAAETAGLVEMLQGETALTLFAPNNAAFEALPPGVWNGLLADPELLLGALTYHALAGTQTTAALVSGDYETLNGASVTVVVTNVIRVNHAEVTQGDLLASNGVAHVIDTVLLLEPPQIVTQPETPVGAYVGNTISLSVVATGAEPIQYQWTKDGLDLAGATTATFMKADAQVSDSGLYAVKVTNPGGTVTSSNAVVTVTVPTLWQILESTPELSTLKAAVETAGLVESLEGAEALTLFAPTDAAFEALPAGVWDALLADPELLLGALTYHALAGTQTTAALVSADYETLNGASVTVVVTNVIRVNHAEVIQGDLLASNGVAHVIDTVLLLEPPQIVTQPETPVGAYVGNTISLSVVAIGADPVQYQWTKAGVNLAGATTATFMKTNAQVADSGLYAVKVTNPGGTVTSSNAVVTVTVPTLWQILESTPELSTLKAAVETAGLVESLEGAEALTLFAPNNAAFEALPAGVWDGLLADPEQLMAVLTYHALGVAQTTSELVSADYETLNGASVTVVVTNVILVNDALVIDGDRLATNGVAHVIDAVLWPPEPPIIGPPAVVDGNFTITWTGGGELETATDVSGPWVPTGNTSGSFSEPIGSGNRFYRIVLSR